jgi:hypothetical protein
VHRHTTIFVFCPCRARNIITSLSIFYKEGSVLRWPGSLVAREESSDASDVEFFTQHALWAALEPNGKSKAFSCTNEDAYKCENLRLATHFEGEWSGYDKEDKSFKPEEVEREGRHVGREH